MLGSRYFALLAAIGLFAQIPDKFENLEIYPKDISRRQLVGAMRNIAGALGVGCKHCHVGESVMTLDNYDFASDEKETKKTAREMMRMVNELNDGFFKERQSSISCDTCHHGVKQPRSLINVMMDTISDKGIEAGIAEYRDLHASLYGSDSYDFRAATLSNVARRLANQQKQEEAFQLHQLNLEMYPNDALSLFNVGSHLLVSEKDMSVAHPYFLKAVAHDSLTAANSLNRLAYYLSSLDRTGEGLHILKLLTVLVPDYANGFDSYGEFLAKEGRIVESIAAYERALQIDSSLISASEALLKLKSVKEP